jgi:rSAM/selenodomain-associated transferase 2
VKLSIIIPTLNEVLYLPTTIDSARRQAMLPVPEIIVADCNSKDGTADLAARLGVEVVQGQALASRAAALNAGASRASGDVLLFLDADCLLPRGYDLAIRKALANPRVVGGAFEFALDGRGPGLRIIEIINRTRYRIWPQFYGDQGIFARTEIFHRVNGYPSRAIMEASDFCRLLSKHGDLRLLPQEVKTSPRRFLEGGIFRVLTRDIVIWWLDFLGRPTEKFASQYRENNRLRGS